MATTTTTSNNAITTTDDSKNNQFNEIVQREKKLRTLLNEVNKNLDVLKKEMEQFMDDPEKQEQRALRDKMNKMKKSLVF